jgi:hypothetical protein
VEQALYFTLLLDQAFVRLEDEYPGLAELCLHRIDHFSPGREHAECRERPGVDDGLAVDQDLEFSVASFDHFDVGSQLATKTRRHTDSVQARHSIGAIADGNPSHADLRE